MLRRILIIAAPFIVRKLLRGKKNFRYLGLLLLLLVGAAWLATNYYSSSNTGPVVTSSGNESAHDKHAAGELSDIQALYESQQSGVMVRTTGNVIRILADDNDGSRHQRFILDTPQQVSVLVAHNIDLAQRVPIQERDQVSIYGQYEWSAKGGVIHWTHHDPKKIHLDGWILHNNVKYK